MHPDAAARQVLLDYPGMQQQLLEKRRDIAHHLLRQLVEFLHASIPVLPHPSLARLALPLTEAQP